MLGSLFDYFPDLISIWGLLFYSFLVYLFVMILGLIFGGSESKKPDIVKEGKEEVQMGNLGKYND